MLWELPRAALEFASLPFALPGLWTTPPGDGHPVLVIPGYLGHDDHTTVLRGFLSAKGYRTFGWELGRNLGMRRAGGLNALLERLTDIYNETNQTKVSLIGWSLGGIFARRMARSRPDLVRQTIVMGSPIGRTDDNAHYVQTVYERVNDQVVPRIVIDQYMMENMQPCSVPSTALYSRTDAIVPHDIAREPESDITENLEVTSSHTGFVVNPEVFYHVARKLAQPEDGWRKLSSLGG